MNFKKLLKVIGAIVAIAGVIAAVYIAIQKLLARKEPEYFDDNDFFECDNEIEIVEAKAEEKTEEPKEEKEELACGKADCGGENSLISQNATLATSWECRKTKFPKMQTWKYAHVLWSRI